MDPNETYRLMLLAYADEDLNAAVTHADDLRAWLRGGGFYPRILKNCGIERGEPVCTPEDVDVDIAAVYAAARTRFEVIGD